MQTMTKDAGRIIHILSERIRVLEVEKAHLMDENLSLQAKLKESEKDGNTSKESVDAGGNRPLQSVSKKV